jgi:hypothetical protein
MATLIVFVDALPFAHLPRLPRLGRWPWRAGLRPGFGYSINLHAELFAGLTPDEVGFFGEWALDRSGAPARRYRRALPALQALCRPYVLNRGLQTVLTHRYRPGRIMPNLPLARLADFTIRGEKITDAAFPRPTMFSRHPELIRVAAEGLPKGHRDAALLDRAEALVRAGAEQVYLPLPDLDGIGHRCRTDSAEWNSHLRHLDQRVDVLANHFLARFPDGDVFVVSDHGMADVRGGVRFGIEAALGPARADRYLYFTDSTLVRAWASGPLHARRVADFVAGVPHLRVVTDDERREYGLTDPSFGGVIGVLDEGWCFEPSTFARHIPRAMHGYHPDVPSQQAVLLHRGAHPPAGPVQRTVDAHAVFEAALARG